MTDKICPKCGDSIPAVDPKGDGIYFEWYCEECEEFIED